MSKPEERDEMREFEQKLARALGPVEAPEGFAERVLARVEADGVQVDGVQVDRVEVDRGVGGKVFGLASQGRLPGMPARWSAWGAVAALLVVGCVAGEGVHRHRQLERAAMAERQFETAIQVTDRTLDHVREQLSRAGVRVAD